MYNFITYYYLQKHNNIFTIVESVNNDNKEKPHFKEFSNGDYLRKH